MNKSERFFRRYIFSIVSIIILFLFVNILLVTSFFAAAYLGNVKNSNFPIEDFSNHITETNGQFNADIQAEEMLNNACAWAMILDENGNIIWEMNVPEELPRHYSTTDVAMFSRWFPAGICNELLHFHQNSICSADSVWIFSRCLYQCFVNVVSICPKCPPD